MIEAEAVGNSDANSSQGDCVGRKGVFPAKANDPITYLKLIGAYVCSHTGDDASGFDSE